jgi:bacterioferritin (cytochrome b1)
MAGGGLRQTENIVTDNDSKLIEQLNRALGLELRAVVMYAHYAAYVKGIYRLHLKPFFEGEATESFTHAGTVRHAINQLGGIAVTDRDPMPIVHTTDYEKMLQEVLRTETMAAETYRGILENLGDNEELYDLIEQIYFAEVRSMEELNQLI